LLIQLQKIQDLLLSFRFRNRMRILNASGLSFL